ncbi:MAG: hypothetical protein HQ516_03265 [Chlorobium sp.]|nr:hypothetical protein [Chlorobium phaeovibrioides]NQU46050.1 hypothetical protein [Chlorobium sp.]
MKISRLSGAAFVEAVFSILFFKVSVRAGRVRRGIEIIEIGFVNNLIKRIRHRVRMNGIHQDDCIYVHDSSSSPVISKDCSEGTLIYDFQYKMQERGFLDAESLSTEGMAAGLKALIVVALCRKFIFI